MEHQIVHGISDSSESMVFQECPEVTIEMTQRCSKLEMEEAMRCIAAGGNPTQDDIIHGNIKMQTFGQMALQNELVGSSSADGKLPHPNIKAFLEDELKIYPVSLSDLKVKPKQYKTARKFVPEHQKDEKYYTFREKNNAAVRRSREAAYEKEKRLKLRLAFLEQEDERLREENHFLRSVIEDRDAEINKLKQMY